MMDGLESDAINPSLITEASSHSSLVPWTSAWDGFSREFPRALRILFIDRTIAHLYGTHCDGLVCLYIMY